METKDKIKELKDKTLGEFDYLMELIDNQSSDDRITEQTIQRQLGVVFHYWSEMTDLQREERGY